MLDDVKSLLIAAQSALTDLGKAAYEYTTEFDEYLENHQIEVLGEPDLELTRQIILRKLIGTLNEKY